MNVTPAIVSRLLEDPVIASIAANRVAREQAPSEWSGMTPYLIVNSENAGFNYHSRGIARPTETSLDIEVYANDASQIDAIVRAVCSESGTFNTKSWTSHGIFVERVFTGGVNFSTQPESGGRNHCHYSRVINCTVWWSEAA